MVSPTAYLADLLDYAVDHLRSGGAPISLAWLSTQFHQPFDELAASCSEAQEQVRQVRLCIEVLRDYLKTKPPPVDKVQPLAKAEQAYLFMAYTTLLTRLGTSYEDIRLLRTASPAAQNALVERLGIDDATRLEELLLEPGSADPHKGLTEEVLALERNPYTARQRRPTQGLDRGGTRAALWTGGYETVCSV